MKTADIRVILVDDDKISLTILENFCRKSGRMDVAGTFNNPGEALVFLKENIVDLVFLDVEMPEISGFELLDRLPYLPRIILTTSKTDYAFTAFQYEVADYLKKPLTYDRFIRSISKVADAIVADKQEKFDAGSTNNGIASSGKEMQDIFIRADGKHIRLSMDDILFVECVGDYVKYVTADKKLVTHATMKSVLEKLDPAMFLKVHRSYIVNARKIKDIQDNTLVINGNVIPISRAHKSEVMQRLKIS